MQRALVERIAPRLRNLTSGGYGRSYVRKGRIYSSSLQLAVAEILDSLRIKNREMVEVPGTSLRADFETNGVFIFVDRNLGEGELRELRRTRNDCVLIGKDSLRSDSEDSGIRVIQIGTARSGRVQTIFLDDPSFNFDYAHILPHTEKCSVMHGHTSSALVEIIGEPIDGMVVDFGLAKDSIREAIRSLDHKLFIDSKYITGEDKRSVTLQFTTVHGPFTVKAPRGTTVLLDGEATVENLAKVLLDRISPAMPENVSAVGVYVYEGLNKGTHLLAEVHRREGEKRRRKR